MKISCNNFQIGKIVEGNYKTLFIKDFFVLFLFVMLIYLIYLLSYFFMLFLLCLSFSFGLAFLSFT